MRPMSDCPARVIVSRDVVFRQIGAESVLLDLKGENCFSLDEVGARIWSLLATDPDVSHAVEALLAEFDVSEASLHASLARLLGELAAAGLVDLKQ